MSDPRNVAHDKKVADEKKHHGEPVDPDALHVPQPGKKPAHKHEPKATPEHPDAPHRKSVEDEAP